MNETRTDNTRRTAVVIVTWNVHDLIMPCLRSVLTELAAWPAGGEVWVVDNASTDGTLDVIREAFPAELTLHLLEPGENLGFAGGNNLALRAMGFPDGDDLPATVLLLNPDTVMQPGSLAALIEGLEQADAGLAGAQLLYSDGSFQHSAFAFPGLWQLIIELFPVPGRLYESSLNGRYPQEWYTQLEPFDVGHPLGATFLLRREAIQQTGLFDERFELYCEEIDWAMRIHAAGWRVVCVPTAEVIHYGGQSTSQVRPWAELAKWTARLQLYAKHYSPLKAALARIIIRAGMNRQIKLIARDSQLPDKDRKALVESCREVIRRTRTIRADTLAVES